MDNNTQIWYFMKSINTILPIINIRAQNIFILIAWRKQVDGIPASSSFALGIQILLEKYCKLLLLFWYIAMPVIL